MPNFIGVLHLLYASNSLAFFLRLSFPPFMVRCRSPSVSVPLQLLPQPRALPLLIVTKIGTSLLGRIRAYERLYQNLFIYNLMVGRLGTNQ